MRYRNTMIATAISLSLIPLYAAANVTNKQSHGKSAFAEGHPVGLSELPMGKLRARIESLPPAAQQQALNWLQRFSFPGEDLDYLRADHEGAIFYSDTAKSGQPQTTDAIDRRISKINHLFAQNGIYFVIWETQYPPR